jgi:two-component system capsular synthesis sensor histidine kinase RcsC
LIPFAHNCRVLVADRNAEVLRAVNALFSRYGYPVTPAGSGTAALRLIECQCYHMVVSGFHIPPLNGYQLARRIKRANPLSKVVIMTGNGITQAAEYIDCREIDDWLFKPFGIQALSDVLTSLGLPDAFRPAAPTDKKPPRFSLERDTMRAQWSSYPHDPVFPDQTPSSKGPSPSAIRGY